MKDTTQSLIDEYRNMMNGYVALLSYRYVNLCIKADPVSLLGVKVSIDDADSNIEDVAMVGAGDNEFKINVYLKDDNNLYQVGKGIAVEHPEFKQEIDTLTVQNGTKIKYIRLTMPEVNDDRKKVLTDSVKVLHDECAAKMQARTTAYQGKLTIDLVGQSKEIVDEANNSFQEITDSYNKTCEDLTADKNKEIEDAYAAYLKKKESQENAKKEEEDAKGTKAMSNLKMK